VHRVNYVIEIMEEGYKQRDTLTSNYFLPRIKPSAVCRKFSESTSKVNFAGTRASLQTLERLLRINGVSVSVFVSKIKMKRTFGDKPGGCDQTK